MRVPVCVPARRWLVAALTAMAIAAGTGAAAAGATPTEAGRPKPISGTWVGTVEGSDAYVAIVVGRKGKQRPAGAYLCDSAAQALWFFGSTNNRRLDLPGDDDAGVEAKVTKKTVTGTITLADGTTLDFSATRAKKPAGIYRGADRIAGDDYEGGWIVLPDGTQRGAVIKRNTGDAPPFAATIDPASPSVTIEGESLEAERVAPWTDPDTTPWIAAGSNG